MSRAYPAFFLDDDDEILADLREHHGDAQLQQVLVWLVDLRNHADTGSWVEDRAQACLLLAAQVRDERAELTRSVDDAMNPFHVVEDTADET